MSAGLLAVALSSPLFAAANTHKAPSLQERLQTRVPALDEAGSSPIQGLIHTAFKYQLPFALEYMDRDAVKVQARLRLPAATVRHRIQSLVGMMPGIRVSFSDGLVDVYSPAARADPSNLLNVVLRHLSVQRLDAGLAATMVLDALVAQKTGAGMFSSVASVPGPLLTIDAHNIRVYEVLNRIVSEQGRSMWLVNVPPDKLSKLTGNLWQFHSFDSVLEQTVIERLLDLFPK